MMIGQKYRKYYRDLKDYLITINYFLAPENVHHYHFLVRKVWLVTIFLIPLIFN